MDRPKRQFSWLESFPPDIWAYIVYYLPGEQLGRLMMTGATFLWRRLKSPHVVKSINLGGDFMVFKSLPRFLNDFPSLEELYIDGSSDEWSDGQALKLESIPSGLRKLELNGIWDERADKLFGEDGATLKLNEHLSRLEELALENLSFRSYSWMRYSPPSLRELRIGRWDGSVELPASLLRFEAENVELSIDSFVSKLPPLLEAFEAQVVYGAELVVPLLPPSTRELLLGDELRYPDGGAKLGQKLLEQLPTSLTIFKVPHSPDLTFVTHPEWARLLPSSLTNLHLVADFPCFIWQHLPPQLTKLTLNTRERLCTVTCSDHKMPSIPFDALPRSITNLQLYLENDQELFCAPPTRYHQSNFSPTHNHQSNFSPTQSHQSYFPPHLTSLNIPTVQLSPQAAKCLPSSLTFLEIANLCERVCEHLPRHLQTLESQSALITPKLIQHLPKSLTSLLLYLPRSDDCWFDCDTGKRVNSVAKRSEYPMHVKSFSSRFDWKDAPLPSTLTRLVIHNAKELGDTFLQHQQLASLKELTMGFSQHFTNLTIPLLSPHLTILNLGRSSNISSSAFECLPRGLTTLHLDSSQSIFDPDIRHLPRCLKYAYFKNAIHLTDKCIPDLPPHLLWLSMKENQHISPTSFPKFPYALRSSRYYKSAEFAHWSVCWGVVCDSEYG